MNKVHDWLCKSRTWERHVRRNLVPWALAPIEPGRDVLEVGPGYGVTTRALAETAGSITALEVDAALARRLSQTMPNVRVVAGDGARMPFADGTFSGVLGFTMLHHVPSTQLQDALFAEAHRVLRPGGVFAGTDSVTSVGFRLIHLSDTMVVVEPATLAARLTGAGFDRVEVDVGAHAFRFRAQKSRRG